MMAAMTDPLVYANLHYLARAAAEQFIALATESIARFGVFRVALSGGSTPRTLFSLLASKKLVGRVDWSRVHLFWGDERMVPPNDPESNFWMTQEALLNHVPIPQENVHRICGEKSPQKASEDYERTLQNCFGTTALFPRFDLVLLGMGTDGHTASLFPNTEALQEKERWVVPNYVEKLETWRVTLTVPVINAAANVTFLVAGDDKARRLREVLIGPFKPDELPSQMIQPRNGNLVWLIDRAAAALL